MRRDTVQRCQRIQLAIIHERPLLTHRQPQSSPPRWSGNCKRPASRPVGRRVRARSFAGRPPKDFDVATNATPQQVRQLFGAKRTIAIGEAFGVIAVLGPAKAVIEVATFRQDGSYSDGRHPDSVTFSDAQADAWRRDFTINGLFFDPITETTVDYVSGEADLRAGIVRAIGRPQDRFQEDKLRILRAVRFAVQLGFQIERSTLLAVSEQAMAIQQVSAERVTAELRRVFSATQAARGLQLLVETGLLAAVLPEVGWSDERACASIEFQQAHACLDCLTDPEISLALAALLAHRTADENWLQIVRGICRRWRTTNAEQQLTLSALRHHASLRRADQLPWSSIQPILIDENARALVDFASAVATSRQESLAGVEFCRARLSLPDDELNPPPLLTGDDLQAMNVPKGPLYGQLLAAVRRAQLDGEVASCDAARSLAKRLRGADSNDTLS